MESTTAAYPDSHDEATERVMRVIDLITARPDISDDDAVADLVREGVEVVDAELLIRFVPCALAFALLKVMGVSNFPSKYQVKNADGQWVELPLAPEHYFSAALSVGFEVMTRGYTERITKAVFRAVATRSAEINAVNQYFASGGTREGLAGSKLGPPAFIGLTFEQIAANR